MRSVMETADGIAEFAGSCSMCAGTVEASARGPLPAGYLGDVVRHVLGVLTVVELRRHLPHAPGAAFLDRVEPGSAGFPVADGISCAPMCSTDSTR
jgi:hypothetical protein